MATKHVMEGEHVYDDVVYMGRTTVQSLDAVKTMNLRDDDVLLITYPKAGTTWISQIVCLLMNQKVSEHIRQSVPILEFMSYHPPHDPVALAVEKLDSPRILTSHLRPLFFNHALKNGSPRVIVLMRNPKDCMVSYYNYYRASGALGKFQGSFTDFFELNKENGLCYGDVIEHSVAWWKYQEDPRFLFLTYENMKKNVEKVIKEIANFLKLDRSDEDIREVIDKSSFEKMSKDPAMNKAASPKEIFDSSISKYLRKGEVGDWQNYFFDEQSKEIDERYQKECEQIGIKYDFSL